MTEGEAAVTLGTRGGRPPTAEGKGRPPPPPLKPAAGDAGGGGQDGCSVRSDEGPDAVMTRSTPLLDLFMPAAAGLLRVGLRSSPADPTLS